MVAEFRRETSLTYMSTSGLGDWAGREQAQVEEVKGHSYQSQMPWRIIGPSSRCQVSAVLPGKCPRPRRWPGLCGTLPNFPSSSYKQGACQAVIHTHTHTQASEPITDYFCFLFTTRAISAVPLHPKQTRVCPGGCQEVKESLVDRYRQPPPTPTSPSLSRAVGASLH